MSRRHFSLLLVVTVIVAALVLLVPGKTGRESEVGQSPLMPGLQDRVNELDWLQVSAADGNTVVTLKRGAGFWQVQEAHGYRADWEQVRILLSDLSQAQVVERKTANPAYYQRLGVEDVSQPDAQGLLIDFGHSDIPSLIVGKRAEGRDGHYVRLQDHAESVLIDRSLEAPRVALDWLDSDIIHVADTEVVEVEVVHPDDERVRALKASADDENFDLQGVPEGAEIKSAWSVNSLANGLASLNLEGVVPDTEIAWNGATRFGLLTADGLRVDAELVAAGNRAEGDAAEAAEGEAGETEYWIRLQASLYQTAVESAVAAEQDPSETRERAGVINGRVNGWAYRIPKYKYDAMTKRMKDLLNEADEPSSL
jgi:hypothetical protein